MNVQNNPEATTKQRKSLHTRKQKGTPALPYPADDDKDAWRRYWQEQGQDWRIEPLIDGDRQKYLTEQCSIIPNIEQGIYPFKDASLDRADVEWLLAAHDNGRGPIFWDAGR